MHKITANIPEPLHARLELLASRIDRKKSALIRQALEDFLEEMEDISTAHARLASLREEEMLTMGEIEQKYGLDG
jgi:predicted DNA-binding protein